MIISFSFFFLVSIDLPTVNADNIKHFSAVRNVHGGTWPMDLSATIDHRKLKVHCCANERSLLSFALGKQQYRFV